MLSIKSRLTLSEFKRSESGNMALMTAILLLMLVFGVGIAIDMSDGVRNKSRLANASDAVSLMIANSDLETKNEMMKAAQVYLDEVYVGAEGAQLKVLDVVREGDSVTVRLSDKTSRSFRPDTLETSVSSTAVYSKQAMDIALVLDTTDSMRGSRIASLKVAATNMVNIVDEQDNDNVRMSVVPFSNYVNIGTSRRNEPWLSVPPDSSRTENRCRKKRDVTSTSNCRNETRYRTRDGIRESYTARVCNRTYGPEYEVCGPRTITKRWNGCVGSRNEPFDERTAFGGRKIPGLQNVNCAKPLQPMDSNLSAARATIAGLNTRGNTYMPSGLLWGWRSLTAEEPLKNSVDAKVERVLILMTDGENTKSKNGDRHEGNNKSAADTKTRTLCNAIKNDKVRVFTIAYEVTDATTKTLLSGCASNKDHYFDARNAGELTDAFRDIAASLNRLRISA